MRKELAETCRRVASPVCTWIPLGTAGARYSTSDILAKYRASVFCLHPPGDSPTRKGIFDRYKQALRKHKHIPGTRTRQHSPVMSAPLTHPLTLRRTATPPSSLLSGCIPVVFDKFSMGSQYPYHIRPQDLEFISVLIPADTPSASFLQYLAQHYDAARVKTMQRRIAQVAFGLQYRFDATP